MPAHQYSVTKAIAFESMTADVKGEQYRLILALFVDHSVLLTNKEIAERTGILYESVCARRNELVRDGHLVKRGVRTAPRTNRPSTTVGLSVNA